MSLLLCILLGFVLWWIIRIVTAVHHARNQFRQFFNGGNAPGSYAESTSERKGGWSAPLRRRKKIDPAVGEYVKFTETTATETTTKESSTESSTRVTVEERVTDIEWEEISR